MREHITLTQMTVCVHLIELWRKPCDGISDDASYRLVSSNIPKVGINNVAHLTFPPACSAEQRLQMMAECLTVLLQQASAGSDYQCDWLTLIYLSARVFFHRREETTISLMKLKWAWSEGCSRQSCWQWISWKNLSIKTTSTESTEGMCNRKSDCWMRV